MLLTATTDKISLITSETCDVDVVASYIDRNQSTGAIGQANRQLTTIATGTTTDIVAAPGATTTRKIQQLTIRNAHASTAVDVTVQFNANGTLYEMHAERLYATEILEWDEDTGFKKRVRKNPTISGAKLLNTTEWDSDTTALHRPCTELSFNLQHDNTKYGNRSFGTFGAFITTAAATTTGVMNSVCSTSSPFSSIMANIVSVILSVGTTTCLAACAGASWTTTNGVAPPTIGTTPATFGLILQAGGGQIAVESNFSTYNIAPTIRTEVAASLVGIMRGSWFELFEHTG